MTVYAFDDFELDTKLYELRCEGARCQLEPQVFDVLAYLVEHRDRVVPKDELIDRIWPERYISESSLASRLKAARKALRDTGQEQRYIRTVHGRGYQFIGDARETDASSSTAVAGPRLPVPAPRPVHQRIQFCTTRDGVRIAFATAGEGPPLIKTANWLSHLEYDWQSPIWRSTMQALAQHHTLVRYDQRGMGMSQTDVGDVSLEGWLLDLEAVVDALGIDRFSMLGISQGGPIAIVYAAKHPERVEKLVLYGSYARYPHRIRTDEEKTLFASFLNIIRTGWGKNTPAFRDFFANLFVPEGTRDQIEQFTGLDRVSATPEAAARLIEVLSTLDVRDLAASVTVPALVLGRSDDRVAPIRGSRELASLLPNARFVPLPGANHLILEGEPEMELFLGAVGEFLGWE